MNELRKVERRDSKKQEVRALVEKAKATCYSFFQDDYRYSDFEAIEELGLDDELIHQLVEDYVIQIIKSVDQFRELLDKLQDTKNANEELNFKELRELAHKNLGVARNLRIKDGEVILNDLMKKDDLTHLFVCLETLKACAIRLKPECAFNTIKLIEVKNTF